MPGGGVGSPGAGRLVNGRSRENSTATPTGGLWPNAPTDQPPLNGRCRDVTDVGFVGHRTEKGRLPPTNSARSWRPETGRPEIEPRGFTKTRRSAADQFELRLLIQSHGLNPSVPRLGGIGDPCRTRHRQPGSVVFADPYCPATDNKVCATMPILLHYLRRLRYSANRQHQPAAYR